MRYIPMSAPQEITIDSAKLPIDLCPRRDPFVMGTLPTGLRKTDHEEPQRTVTLNAYCIGRVPRD